MDSPIKPNSNQLEAIERLIAKHRRPLPQIRAGRALLQSGSCHALNDISDGLASEAWEIAEASNVGIMFNERQIPIDPDLQVYAELSGKAAMDWIFNGGEDYQLIGTVSKSDAAFVEQEFGRRQLYYQKIGEVTDLFTGVHLLKKEGTTIEVPKKGYNHFA
jgi:thiamine-monophosphate kinase